jgi:hypothetical protein
MLTMYLSWRGRSFFIQNNAYSATILLLKTIGDMQTACDRTSIVNCLLAVLYLTTQQFL